jgi:nucleotide-binding universal stress UspA family protein
MAANIIVSYDGTDNDRDALALGKALAGGVNALALAYVRHADAERSNPKQDPQAMLDAAAAGLEGPVSTHVLQSGSTPEGLRQLAVETGGDVVVFGPEYRTAVGHVNPQTSARRLLDGGPVAIALAPAGYGRADSAIKLLAAIGEDGDPCVRETADRLAARIGAAVANQATSAVDLMVVGSKPGTVTGRVTISAAADYLIELAQCPVLVLPRGVVVEL